ncbi:hypothetical protein DPSP01_014104 [Paraphaeosphaeria sporulosa]
MLNLSRCDHYFFRNLDFISTPIKKQCYEVLATILVPSGCEYYLWGDLYKTPNEDYARLFHHQLVALPSSQQGATRHPVIVAHFVLSVVWLLHETLADDTLPEDGWIRLVDAAESLTQEKRMQPPPSAQKAVAPASQSRKRPLPSTPGRTPKRARTETDETLSVRSQPSELGGSDEEAERPAMHRMTMTMTNNNRRADQLRRKKLAFLRERARRACGLLKPDDGAAGKEKDAYASITPKEEPTVAWLFKQPSGDDDADFYTSTTAPYTIVRTLCKKAQALENTSSLVDALEFLVAWRRRGSPFRSEVELDSSQDNRISTTARQLQLSGGSTTLETEFCIAYRLCTRCDRDLAAVHIESRWAAALLGQADAGMRARIRADDAMTGGNRTRDRGGKGKVSTEAIEALMALVGLEVTETSKKAFHRRLDQGKRWFLVAQNLGWGILTMIPYKNVAKSWIESRLAMGQLVVWVDLVKKTREDLYAASKAVERWLGPEGIAGGPISGKQTLSIKAEGLAAIYEIGEVADSEDEGLASETDSSMRGGVGRQRRASSSAAPALRQLTSPELFNPIV